MNPLEADESSWNLLKELYSQMGQDEVTQQSAAVVKDSIELIEFALASVCHSKEAPMIGAILTKNTTNIVTDSF